VASAVSQTVYPDGKAKLVLRSANMTKRGEGVYKFKSEVRGLSLIHGDVLIKTDTEGGLFLMRGPDMKGFDPVDFNDPSTAYVGSLSRAIGVPDYQVQYQSSCYYYSAHSGEVYPAYVFHVNALFRATQDSFKLITNAKTGDILEESPLLIPMLYRKIYDYQFGSTTPTVPARKESDPAVGISGVDNAYTSAGETYWFYSNILGRTSWDDAGADVKVYTNYWDGSLLTNAWWSTIDNSITLGAGFELAYDVLTHEFSHGVARDEGLEYSGESGALHESFADCMSAAKDSSYMGDVWIMGEDSPYPRYLDDPYLHGGADNFFSTNGQAHHDSGVSSLAFYLMAEGGEHPRANTVDVQPIGIADATDILYDALINYYVPYESFQNASYAQMLAAYDNLGYEGVVSVAAAWKAVGVDFYFWGLPGAVDPTYQLSYMGWVTYDIDFQYFWLDSGTRYYFYDNYDYTTGGMQIRCEDTHNWFWTSAEVFPLYWSYTNTSWRYFNGTFDL